MNGHSVSIHSLFQEESATLLLEEKSLSDIESDAGRADIESRFTITGTPFHHRKFLKPKATWHSLIRLTSNLRSTLLRIVIFLLPSFIQPLVTSSIPKTNHHEKPKKTPGPTAYLDGMRGLAALIVFFCHYFYTCFVIAQSYGYGSSNYHILKLPIIRLFYQGPPMVAVFFVISGYALSLKPLKLIRSRNYDSLLKTISSLIFRRGFRLFLPTFISTLMIMLLLRAGAYEWTRDFAYDDKYMRNVQEIHYQRMNSTAEQMADWGREMFRFVHIWDWDAYEGSTAIDVHLWTIPVEFRASMMLFLTILGTARLKTVWRFVFVGAVMGFIYRSARWEMVLFYMGMVFAEWDLVRGLHHSPCSPPSGTREGTAAYQLEKKTRTTRRPPPIRLRSLGRPILTKAWWIAVSILAMYLMSQPDQGGDETPGWVTLTQWIPKWWYAPTKYQHQLSSCPTPQEDENEQEEYFFGQGQAQYRYYQSLGAILMVLSASRSLFWQKVFNSAPIQYLGKISYAIYLMHGPVLHIIGYAIERFVWMNITGVETDTAYVAGFGLASLLVVPIVVWVSDVFWRAVDEPVVRFGKWLEGRCTVSMDGLM
ncbi:Acyltransferase family domain containing protein [Rhypophila sp. PSN 637]